MKKLLILLISVFIVNIAITAQNTFGLKIAEVSNDGTNYVISLSMQMIGDDAATFKLGSSSLQFTFPNDALSNPVLESTTLASPFPYYLPSVTVPLVDQCSFNIELAVPENGTDIAEAPLWTELGQVSFTIDDMDVFTPLSWSYNGGTTQTVVFLDDEATQIYAGSPSEDFLIFEPLETPDELIFTFIPSDVTYQCDEDIPIDLATGTSTCSDVSITFEDESTGDICSTTITRIFTITDDCANFITTTQIITIEDSTAPVIFPSSNTLNFECIDDLPTAQATVSDNCDPNPSTVVITETSEGECPTIVTRTYNSTDACGNTAELIQTITILDETPPIISNQTEDLIINCGDEIPAVVDPTVIDNCTDNILLDFDEVTEGECPGTITRTWIYTDDCGNTSTSVQLISIDNLMNVDNITSSSFTVDLITNSLLEITSDKNLDVNYTIYNAVGQVVRTELVNIATGKTDIRVDISTYPSGVYYLSVSNGSERITKSIVKK